MVAWYSKLIIRSSSVSFFHWHPLTVCLMWRSRSAVVSDLSCLKSPDKRLWNAKMKLIVRSFSRKRSKPGLPSYGLPPCLQECPSGCMLRHLLPQVWGPTASPQVSGLPQKSPSFTAWRSSMRQPCQLLYSSSLDTSPLGPTTWFLQLDGPFRTTKGNWMRAISVTIEDSNLTFGMHWGMLRQCPLVVAYRGRTDRDWIIEVTMCCPERTG